MTIFNNIYDTSACSGYKMQPTIDKLKLAIESMQLQIKPLKLKNLDLTIDMAVITGGNTVEDNIAYFYHPVFIDIDNKNYCVIDVRGYGKWYDPQKTFIVRNQPEYNWLVKRAILSYIWKYDRVEPIRDLSSIIVSTYCSLISESIARKFALDPAEQIKISILAGFFYYCLFTDDKTFEDNDYNKIAGSIARAIKAPAQEIFDIIDGLDVIANLSAFCEILKTKVDSVRLQDFNIGVLISIVSGNWFGTNARENVACALEHVPTWVMICYASIDERAFKRSVLAKLVERFSKGAKDEYFIKSLNSLTKTEKDLDF